ncbi:hypothetical protein AAA799P11_00069 [Marine Group I thaumarchaeote SCGC AAA799-P11]|uniref:Uncharacterized protein n=4 Tax=Marine Group I TaxID=905826 RepID=A0A087S3L8_9ARCH|nr:hypothetical protein AAA799N04_01785 [Marine Group I thaumarchaeote SCGC AAA799-N04]KFM17256.1 hypothetical protein SCCGRSA3_01944 [Marine Group I thaumarchaeote SCGC RSA3]KFM20322.1 hypothetical protein AAA799P11_00069 [Marine Group I thaumarchaeote SCGC AAA799-P11]
MPETLQKNKSELGLTFLVIILSGASASLLLLPPLGLIPYATFRDVAIIPSVIIIFAIGILSRSKFPRLSSRLFKGMARIYCVICTRSNSYSWLHVCKMDSNGQYDLSSRIVSY